MYNKEQKAAYYQKVKETIRKKYLENGGREKERLKYLENKNKAIEMSGGCCFDCGLKSEYTEVYDFHHENPNEKEYRLSNILKRSWDVIEQELKKCTMLCANCHRIRHAKERK